MKPWELSILSITLIFNLNLAIAAKDNPPTDIKFSNQLPTEGNLVLSVYAEG